ncbi:MAG TPA: hypothetical protein VMV50_02470 [Candidatus Paceibacterota bacterium]|nr:hypothetical protein [Candidatus Paceibacterota bacterium]
MRLIISAMLALTFASLPFAADGRVLGRQSLVSWTAKSFATAQQKMAASQPGKYRFCSRHTFTYLPPDASDDMVPQVGFVLTDPKGGIGTIVIGTGQRVHPFTFSGATAPAFAREYTGNGGGYFLYLPSREYEALDQCLRAKNGERI